MTSRLALENFGGGIWRQPDSLPGHVYDAINAIVDGPTIMRRGGTDFFSSAAPGTPTSIAAVDVGAAQRRVLAWNASSIWALADDGTWSAAFPSAAAGPPPRFARPATQGRYAALLNSTSASPAFAVYLYAGGTVAPLYNTGTVTISAGSTSVTGSGTSWSSSNVGPGSLISVGVGGGQAIVDKVNSATSLTLLDPWPAIAVSGIAYSLRISRLAFTSGAVGAKPPFSLASVAGRLVLAAGPRAQFSPRDNASASWSETDYWDLSSDASTLGLSSFKDTLVWFTTRGVWLVSNLAYDLTDDAGNVQHRVSQVSKDLILWGDPSNGGACGVVGWSGNLVIPATDGVYVMGPDGGTTLISEGIGPLYRAYLDAGYTPGPAVMFDGHYILPIADSTTTAVDVLVCRMTPQPAWTRWGAGASSTNFAVLSRSSSQRAKLLGLRSTRLIDATACLHPKTVDAEDSDGSSYALDVTTNDVPAGANPFSTVMKIRVRYDYAASTGGSGTQTLTSSWGSGPEGSTMIGLGGQGLASSQLPLTWQIVKRARSARFRLLSSGAVGTLRLRSIEMFARPSSRP